MKSSILICYLILLSSILLAQEPQGDPETPIVGIEEKDSIPTIDVGPELPNEIRADTIEISTDKTQSSTNNSTEKEIKYYQSVSNSRPKKKKRNRDDIKTLTGRMSHSGGFGALTFKSTDYRSEAMVLAGVRGGWIINRTLAIGLEGHGIIPTAKYGDLNPISGEDANVLGGYGGLFIEPVFFSNEVVHIVFPISAGAGWMGYQEVKRSGHNGSDGLISDDVFWYVEPGAALELNIARNFRLNFGVSKRFTQDLVMYNTEEDDFNTTNYFLTLKVGGF